MGLDVKCLCAALGEVVDGVRVLEKVVKKGGLVGSFEEVFEILCRKVCFTYRGNLQLKSCFVRMLWGFRD